MGAGEVHPIGGKCRTCVAARLEAGKNRVAKQSKAKRANSETPITSPTHTCRHISNGRHPSATECLAGDAWRNPAGCKAWIRAALEAVATTCHELLRTWPQCSCALEQISCTLFDSPCSLPTWERHPKSSRRIRGHIQSTVTNSSAWSGVEICKVGE
nr:hypothetical protein CFP56_20953 [Quercus suber]